MGSCPGGEWTYSGELSRVRIRPGGEVSRWGIVLVGIVLLGNCPVGEVAWWGVVLVGTCPDGEFSRVGICSGGGLGLVESCPGGGLD